MGTRPPSDAAAMARCVGELCAPQNTRPSAKVYTVMREASTRSARYLRSQLCAEGGEREGGEREGGEREGGESEAQGVARRGLGGQHLVRQCAWLEPRSSRHTVPCVPREAAQRTGPHVGGKGEQPLDEEQSSIGFVRQRRSVAEDSGQLEEKQHRRADERIRERREEVRPEEPRALRA